MTSFQLAMKRDTRRQFSDDQYLHHLYTLTKTEHLVDENIKKKLIEQILLRKYNIQAPAKDIDYIYKNYFEKYAYLSNSRQIQLDLGIIYKIRTIKEPWLGLERISNIYKLRTIPRVFSKVLDRNKPQDDCKFETWCKFN
jgi:hypothetical protein